MNDNINIRLEKIKIMRAAYFHALSDNPEEDAWKKAEKWADQKGLLKKESTLRIFGRNTYPTENPEPHGYGFFITITPDIKVEKDIFIRLIAGGLYAVALCEGLEQMGIVWPELWKWVGESEYNYIGETKGDNGFELGFEEHLNWYSTFIEKSEKKFIFNLMLQLWEQ